MASFCMPQRCSSPLKLSVYTLHMGSVPEGRTANQPSALEILIPPMGASLPGALVIISVTGEPPRLAISALSGVKALSFART